jgi:hypothetical protein
MKWSILKVRESQSGMERRILELKESQREMDRRIGCLETRMWGLEMKMGGGNEDRGFGGKSGDLEKIVEKMDKKLGVQVKEGIWQ